MKMPAATVPAPRRRRGRLDVAALALAPAGILMVLLSQFADGGPGTALLQGAAAVIVFGGTLGAVLLTFSPAEVLAACRAAGHAFQVPENDVDSLAAMLVAMSIRAHRRGVLTLENELDTIADPFFREVLTMTIDGTTAETFHQLVAIEQAARDAEEEAPARVFEAAAGYAPTMGILGAVLGLIRVMQNLGTPVALGSGIAAAFVATAYGVGIANLVLLPIAGRLRERAADAARRRELITQGVCAIHKRTNPRLVAQGLRAHAVDVPRLDEMSSGPAPRGRRTTSASISSVPS
jgi:chemotaxis protein MotA